MRAAPRRAAPCSHKRGKLTGTQMSEFTRSLSCCPAPLSSQLDTNKRGNVSLSPVSFPSLCIEILLVPPPPFHVVARCSSLMPPRYSTPSSSIQLSVLLARAANKLPSASAVPVSVDLLHVVSLAMLSATALVSSVTRVFTSFSTAFVPEN